jgi:hypothetical protein
MITLYNKLKEAGRCDREHSATCTQEQREAEET